MMPRAKVVSKSSKEKAKVGEEINGENEMPTKVLKGKAINAVEIQDGGVNLPNEENDAAQVTKRSAKNATESRGRKKVKDNVNDINDDILSKAAPTKTRARKAATTTTVELNAQEVVVNDESPAMPKVKGRAKKIKDAAIDELPETKEETASLETIEGDKKTTSRGRKKKEIAPSTSEVNNVDQVKPTKGRKRQLTKSDAQEGAVEEEQQAVEIFENGESLVKSTGMTPTISAATEVKQKSTKLKKQKKIMKNEETEKVAEEVVSEGEAPVTKKAKVAAASKKNKPTAAEKPKRAGKTKAVEKVVEADVDDNDIEEAAVAKPLPSASRGGRKRTAAVAKEVNIDEDEAVDGPKSSKLKKTAQLLNSTDSKYNKADFELPANIDNDDGEVAKRNYLKISSWNVAGLRSWLKKDGLKFLDYEEPDIFCLQETKCADEQLPEEAQRISGYHPYWLCMPGGYAGVAIYSKIMPINVEYGIGDVEFDDVGRIITAEYEKFFLINVYVPNSGRKLVNLDARMRWEKLFQAFVQKYDANKPVIICGDMNVSHLEIDLANPKTNTRNAGFTQEERDKMTELLALGFVDTFRHLYPKRTGAYTFWTYMSNARARNVGWRLDYFIVSERFLGRVVDNCMRTQCLGSDHCPITLFMKL